MLSFCRSDLASRLLLYLSEVSHSHLHSQFTVLPSTVYDETKRSTHEIQTIGTYRAEGFRTVPGHDDLRQQLPEHRRRRSSGREPDGGALFGGWHQLLRHG